MPDSLTPRQLQFAALVAEGKPLADAYRRVYRPSATTKSTTIHEEASRVAANRKVAARVAELQAHVAARAHAQHAVSTDALLAECAEAFAIAESKRDANAMAAITRLKAQLTGLLVRERDNARAPLQDVPDEQVEAELARLREERDASTRSIH